MIQNKTKNILFVASECQPFIASGGLADVIGSLPKAISSKNIKVSVVVPYYSKIQEKYKKQFEFIGQTNVKLSWRNQYCGFYKYEEKNVVYYFIDNEYYFNRDKLYGYYDDAERFAFFSKAVIELMLFTNEIPNIIHAHDWQAGMTLVYLRTLYYGNILFKDIKTIFTIHNIEYQGAYQLDADIVEDVFGISMNDSYLLEYKGGLNIMKGALEAANKVSTVSPTYAEQICTPEFAHGLEHEIIRIKNEGKLFGVINGIDTNFYSPKKDKDIKQKYDINTIELKKVNKEDLQETVGLEKTSKPIVSMVTRLVHHKGLEILKGAMDKIMQEDIQMVILGTGDKYYEYCFEEFAKKYPNKLKVIIDYNQKLSRKIYAGSDIFLMPSLSEPCGLSQMISTRYGTIALVRETGGLKDSITPFAKGGNGYTFKSTESNDLYVTLKEAINDYNSDKWSEYIIKAMGSDFSWKNSAKQYISEYNRLIK